MKHSFKERLQIAKSLEKDILSLDIMKGNLSIAFRAIEIVETDEVTFKQLFQEDMPAHMKKALFIEYNLWVQIKDSICFFSKVPMPEDEFLSRAKRFQPVIQEIIQIIELEIEMLYSPLIKHYQDLISNIEGSTGSK